MGERIDALVDRGYNLAGKIKQLEKELKEVKEGIKSYAKKHKTSEIEGRQAIAKVSPYTTSDCDPNDLLAKLKELKREEEFTNLVTVAVGPTKKAIGELIFLQIADVETIDYHVVKFKKHPDV